VQIVSDERMQPLSSKLLYPAFTTTGVRVPAFVISPWVEPRQVYKGVLDHTSVLKFIAAVFGNGSYSPAVDARTGVGSVQAVLARDTPRDQIPAHPSAADGSAPGNPIATIIPQAFASALARLRDLDKDVTKLKFPTLFHRF
jgi:phospholipase C